MTIHKKRNLWTMQGFARVKAPLKYLAELVRMLRRPKSEHHRKLEATTLTEILSWWNEQERQIRCWWIIVLDRDVSGLINVVDLWGACHPSGQGWLPSIVSSKSWGDPRFQKDVRKMGKQRLGVLLCVLIYLWLHDACDDMCISKHIYPHVAGLCNLNACICISMGWLKDTSDEDKPRYMQVAFAASQGQHIPLASMWSMAVGVMAMTKDLFVSECEHIWVRTYENNMVISYMCIYIYDFIYIHICTYLLIRIYI